MKISAIILLFCLLSFTSKGQGETSERLPDALTYLDAWLEAQQAYDHIPGISVAIVKDQELIWSKGYGWADVQNNVPATPATLYSICSITKLFTSIAIMQLYEKGKLRLDDTLTSILPERNIRQQYKDSGPITIRGLLTHSSGLPRESDFPYWSGPDYRFPTKKQVAEKLKDQQTLYPAATYFQYSNLGMTLLGEVVEKISGKPYEVYVEENILKPLRLNKTYPTLPSQLWGNKLAKGYSALNREGTRDIIPVFDAKAIQPAAGYASTVEDLALFASWQFRLLSNGGKEILSASTLREMQRVHWIDPDWKANWGLGFAVFQHNGSTLTGHWGSCPGYHCMLLQDPKEKLAVIVLTNSNENPWKYASQMRNIFLRGEREKTKNSEADLSQYTGLYNGKPYGSEKKVLNWYGELAILDLPTENPLESMILLKHIHGDVFRRIRRDEGLGEEIIFERDPSTGKVVRMWRHSNYSDRLD